MRRGVAITIVTIALAVILLLAIYSAKSKVLTLVKQASGEPFVQAASLIGMEIEKRLPFDQILSAVLDEAIYYALTMGGNVSSKDFIIPIRITPEVYTKYYVYCEKDESNNIKCNVVYPNISNIEQRITYLLKSVYSLKSLRRTNPRLYFELFKKTAPLRPESFKLIVDSVIDWDLVEYRYKGPLLRLKGEIGGTEGYLYFFPFFNPKSRAPVGDLLVASRIFQTELYDIIKSSFDLSEVSRIYVPAVMCEDTGNKPYPKFDWLTFLAWLIDFKCNKSKMDCLKELTGYSLSELLSLMEEKGLVDDICGQPVYNCSKNMTACLYDLNMIEVLKYWYYRALTRGIRDVNKVYYVCVKEKFKDNVGSYKDYLENLPSLSAFFDNVKSLGLTPLGEVIDIYSTLEDCEDKCISSSNEIVLPGGRCREYVLSSDSMINKLAVPIEIKIEELKYNWSWG